MPENRKITEKDFAEILLLYAGLSEVKCIKMLKRVKRIFKEDPVEDEFVRERQAKGITFQEYLDFYKVLKYINDIDTALMFYHIAGASIDKETLVHVARTIANVTLSDHIMEVIFVIFDEDDDGVLSNKEFMSVMKKRMMCSLEKSKDTGFVKLLDAMWKCGLSQTSLEQFRRLEMQS